MDRTKVVTDKGLTQPHAPMVASRRLDLAARRTTAGIHLLGKQWLEESRPQQSDLGKAVSGGILRLSLGMALGCSDLSWREPVPPARF